MDARGKTIVVTGATGNQGGATARSLLADGWHVRALAFADPGRYLGQALEITGDRLTGPADRRCVQRRWSCGYSPSRPSPP